MNYFLKKHKLVAWIVMLTFLFSMVMPTNLGSNAAVAGETTGVTAVSEAEYLANGTEFELIGIANNGQEKIQYARISKEGRLIVKVQKDKANAKTYEAKTAEGPSQIGNSYFTEQISFDKNSEVLYLDAGKQGFDLITKGIYIALRTKTGGGAIGTAFNIGGTAQLAGLSVSYLDVVTGDSVKAPYQNAEAESFAYDTTVPTNPEYIPDEIDGKILVDIDGNRTGTASKGNPAVVIAYYSDPVTINVKKAWVDAEGKDLDAFTFAGVTANIVIPGETADAQAVVKGTIPLSNDNRWNGTSSALAKYDVNGKAIAYKVEEAVVPAGFTAEVTGGIENGFTITNTKCEYQYTVEHYYQNVDGNYSIDATETTTPAAQTVGQSVSAATTTTKTGYVFIDGNTLNNLNGIITEADRIGAESGDPTVLKVYYDLRYAVQYHYTDENGKKVDSAVSAYKYVLGAADVSADAPEITVDNPWYDFDGSWYTANETVWDNTTQAIQNYADATSKVLHLYAQPQPKPVMNGMINLQKVVTNKTTADGFKFRLTLGIVPANNDAATEEAPVAGDNSVVAGDNSETEKTENAVAGDNSETKGTETTVAGDNSATEGTEKPVAGDNSETKGTETTVAGDGSETKGTESTTGDNSATEGTEKPVAGDVTRVVQELNQVGEGINEVDTVAVVDAPVVEDTPVVEETPVVDETPVLPIRVTLEYYNATGELIATEADVTLVPNEAGEYVYEGIVLHDGESVCINIAAVDGRVSYKIEEIDSQGATPYYYKDQKTDANAINAIAGEIELVNGEAVAFAVAEEEVPAEDGLLFITENRYTVTPTPIDPVDPDPKPTPVDPDPKPTPKPPVVPIPDPEVPQAEPEVIPEEAVPLVDEPGEEVVEVVDTPAPLGAPQMGDSSNAFAFAMMLAAAGAGLAITRRKFN